jgi:hypothetical protein
VVHFAHRHISRLEAVTMRPKRSRSKPKRPASQRPPRSAAAPPSTARIAPRDDPVEAVEHVISRRDLLVQDGDIILTRIHNRARHSLSTPSTAEYVLSTYSTTSLRETARRFARYEVAAMEGEQLAAERRVRLFYQDESGLNLLKDYRPA